MRQYCINHFYNEMYRICNGYAVTMHCALILHKVPHNDWSLKLPFIITKFTTLIIRQECGTWDRTINWVRLAKIFFLVSSHLSFGHAPLFQTVLGITTVHASEYNAYSKASSRHQEKNVIYSCWIQCECANIVRAASFVRKAFINDRVNSNSVASGEGSGIARMYLC